MRTLSVLGAGILSLMANASCLQLAGFEAKERVEPASSQDGGSDDAQAGEDADAAEPDATQDAAQDAAEDVVTNPCGAGQTHIPAGKLMMGGYSYSDQQPIHEVSVEAFCVGTTEVTVAQYHDCVAENACTAAGNDIYCNVFGAGRDDHPVNCVSLAQAQQYCAWAKGKVPTEEQWEYAAKGPTTRLYPFGDGAPSTSNVCWTDNGTCKGDVPESDRSYFGVAGMGANVSEWTRSSYCPYSNPFCGATERVVRGGEWYNHDSFMVESASRGAADPGLSGSTVGVRCVWDPAGM